MHHYIIRRLILTLVILVALSFLVFSLLQIMPGNPASAILGEDATKEQIEELEAEMGLHLPFVHRYLNWSYKILHGDFGKSYGYDEKVLDLFMERLPITLFLSILAMIVAIVVGIPAGIVCAIRRNSYLDQALSVAANFFVAVPNFWLGIMGIYIFGLLLRWLPTSGYTSPFDDFNLSISQSIMPVLLLGLPGIAMLTRQTRSAMLEVISQDYIRTAMAKGLKPHQVITGHALKNALIPIVTLLGMHLRHLVGGSVLVETVFNIPGMGRLLVTSAFNKDFMVVQGGVLLIGVVVCFANLLVDISYGWINPAVKYE